MSKRAPCKFCYGWDGCRYASPSPTTQNGAPCGRALALRYRVLHAAGINLSDFSTDSCVAREIKRVEALVELIEAGGYLAGAGDLDAAGRVRLAADFRALLRRVPSARVARSSLSTGKAAGKDDEIAGKIEGAGSDGGWW